MRLISLLSGLSLLVLVMLEVFSQLFDDDARNRQIFEYLVDHGIEEKAAYCITNVGGNGCPEYWKNESKVRGRR